MKTIPFAAIRLGRRTAIAMILVGVAASGACGERLGYEIYDHCSSSSRCSGGRTCVQVRSAQGDAGDVSIGVCASPCTVSSVASSVHFVAGAFGDVCVGIDSIGNVDTTNFGQPGWYLSACGNGHARAGTTDGYVVCTPFDYGGYPIDLWIPTP